MLRHTVPLGTDINGNITRLDNMITSLPDELKAAEVLLENTKKRFENSKQQIEKPFPQKEDLRTKSERPTELNALLDMDHKENEIADSEIADDAPERKSISRNR